MVARLTAAHTGLGVWLSSRVNTQHPGEEQRRGEEGEMDLI